MRMHASWFGSQRPTGYKVAARTPRAATASSPRTRHPDHTERAAVLGSIKARPGNDGACGQRRAMADLDSPCARRPPTHVGRGEETGFQVEQRNWYQGSGECREIVLDFQSPIQGGVMNMYWAASKFTISLPGIVALAAGISVINGDAARAQA